jgi:hypothetical protein
VPFNSIDRVDQYLLVIRGANHSTFSNPESPATRAAHDIIRQATATFLDAYLRDDPAARASLRNGTLAAELGPHASWSAKTPQLRVGKINVSTEPLFSAAEAHGRFYQVANRLAIPTRDALIRRFLLFKEGEPYDSALLSESERNLRALDFLKSATVTSGQTHDGVVDINVTTQDAFTTDVNGDFSNDGGRSLYDVDVTQKDLFGRGLELDVRTAQLRERRTNSLELIDPVAFGRYFGANLLLAKSSDGHEIRFAAARPLVARTIRETTDVTIDQLMQNERLYHNGVVTDLFAQQHRALTAMEGFVVQARPALMTRFLGGIDLTRDTFQPLAGLSPANRDFRFVEAGFDATSLLFATLTHVDYGLKQQDFPIGYHGNVILGRSRGGVSRVRSEQAYGRALDANTLVLTAFNASTRLGPVNRNTLLSADARYIAQFPSRFPQTFIVRARGDAVYQPDRDIQFYADGQNGLRAYPNFALAGTHRFVLNAEDRWYLGRELLQLFEPGAAIFIDSGNAADSGFLRGGLHTDFGAGLRFSVARYESAILRLDLAYAVNATPLNRRGLVFSFATTQAF